MERTMRRISTFSRELLFVFCIWHDGFLTNKFLLSLPLQVEFYTMCRAKSVEITAPANTTGFMRVMDALAFSSAQFAAIVNTCANQSPMDCVKLTRLTATSAGRVD